MIRLLHTSDLHLGKPFGRFPDEVRGRLKQARHGVIERLAQAAHDGGAGVILLAGDTFDAETPAPTVVRQALNAMAAAQGVRWVMMPGNHDSLAASELWRVVERDKPDNVTLALTAEPIEIAKGSMLLPAPCTARNPGRDLTEVMDQPTPEGTMRIGLGHGGIYDFTSLGSGSEDGNAGVIPPDRAVQSGLEYLGLGDWHGTIRVDTRTWYSGTPEKDSFKHGATASALLVTVGGVGALPDVVPVATGAIDWGDVALDFVPGDACLQVLERALPELAKRRDVIARVTAQGRLGLQDATLLRQAIEQVEPDFLSMDYDLSALRLDHDTADLDVIDGAGALRSAAEHLAARCDDVNVSKEDQAIAANALSMLFSFASEAS